MSQSPDIAERRADGVVSYVAGPPEIDPIPELKRAKTSHCSESRDAAPESMLTISRSDVPRFLCKSAFYLSLNDEDGEKISIPERNFKFNDVVSDEDDLRLLLSTLRFWVAEQIPDGLIYFALTGDKDVFSRVIPEFATELSYLTLLSGLRNNEDYDRLSIAASRGDTQILQYLLRNGYEVDNDSVCIAIRDGQAECLRMLCGAVDHWERSPGLCVMAAKCGRLNCLRFLHEQGCPLEYDLSVMTAHAGHLDCLQYVHSQGGDWPVSQLIQAACTGGSVACLQYVHSTLPVDTPLSIQGTDAEYHAVSRGHLDVLRYLHEAGVPWSEKVAEHAASNDQLECLKYVVETGCVVPDNLIYCATDIGCMKYLHSIGCVFGAQESPGLAMYGIEVLRFAHKNGCPWDERTYMSLLDARVIDMECFVYAHEHGCPWSETVTNRVLERKCVNVLRYLRTHKCPGADTDIIRVICERDGDDVK